MHLSMPLGQYHSLYSSNMGQIGYTEAMDPGGL